jgi:uncharacterized protein YecE (DUF72 family)
MGDILIGTSGFSFDDWVGEVYPDTIKIQDMLPYYKKVLGFSTLEENYTYYALQLPLFRERVKGVCGTTDRGCCPTR